MQEGGDSCVTVDSNKKPYDKMLDNKGHAFKTFRKTGDLEETVSGRMIQFRR